MRFSFEVTSELGDLYAIHLTSGEDGFFVRQQIASLIDEPIEIVEIDLERLSGNNSASMKTLQAIVTGIARFFRQNDRAVLYYYCDELDVEQMRKNKKDMWPQEYRSHLFEMLFQRYCQQHQELDILDTKIVIYQSDRPLYMHIIARAEHSGYLAVIRDYIVSNYGK